jgi:hypothetical protein
MSLMTAEVRMTHSIHSHDPPRLHRAGAAEAAVARPVTRHRRILRGIRANELILAGKSRFVLKDFRPRSVTLLDGQLFEGKEIS